MEEKENQSGVETPVRGPGLVRIVGVVAVTLMLYVLSIGPVEKLRDKGIVGDWVLAVYEPVGWLYGHSHVCRRFLQWYGKSVWGVDL